MIEKNMVNAICYKLDKPIIYNEGTQYEKKCDTFLAYYGDSDINKAQEEVDRINQGLIPILFNGQKADIEHKTYFVNVQEAIDTRFD